MQKASATIAAYALLGVTYFVLWIYGIFDAYNAAERYNRRHRTASVL